MKEMNWIIKALILGGVFFIAALIVKPVGVSTQYSVLSGIIHSTIDPDVITKDDARETGYKSNNEYYDRHDGKLAKSIENPWNYDFVFVLSIPLGAFIVYMFNRFRNKDVNAIKYNNSYVTAEGETDEKHKVINTHSKRNLIKPYVTSFIGGFVLLYGARMADGCTSGHMMSGMMQGSVSGYIFAASVFAVAIPTAIFASRQSRYKGGLK